MQVAHVPLSSLAFDAEEEKKKEIEYKKTTFSSKANGFFFN